MATPRTNSTKKIDNNFFTLKLGTTNKNNPLVIYVEGKTFISPKLDKCDYTKDINTIRHAFKNTISKHLRASNLFDNKFILDFQTASNCIAFNKKSFISFQFLFKQNKDNILKLNNLKNESSDMFSNIFADLQNAIIAQNFNLSKTKK